MLLVLAAADSREELERELAEAFPGRFRELSPGMFACEPEPAASASALPHLAFARQILPDAREVDAPSISTWASLLVDAVIAGVPEKSWSLHVYPFKPVSGESRSGARAWHTRTRGSKPAATERASPTKNPVGHERCRLIREATIEQLQRRRRHLLRQLRQHEGAFGEDETLVQLVLTSPEQGFLAIAPAPLPFEARHVLSCFSGGEVALARDQDAPSRAFAKLVEAEARLGRRIGAHQTCVDLGAAPGSWTYVAAQRGARVTAVDRSELAPELMRRRGVRFERGDAFRYAPPAPVDWLLCDVIASPERSAELLVTWLRERWCRQFVVTLKVMDEGAGAVLARLKHELPALTSELRLLRLCSNKKEICAFGTIAR